MGLRDQKRAKNRTPEEKLKDYLSQRSERTQTIYGNQLKELGDLWNASINEIAEVHRDYIKDDNADGTKRAFLQWVKYATEEREPKLSKYSAEGYLKPLNALFGVCGLSKIKYQYSTAHPNASKRINLEQIKELLAGLSDLRMRAIILSLKDSGLRVSDLAQLTIEDFNKAQVHHDQQGNEFRAWATPIIAQKNQVEALVHLGYESINALKAYIGNRTSGNIFMMSHKDAGQKAMKGTDMTIRVGYRCRNLKARGYQISAHSFRKFWLSEVTSHGMPESMAKWLCGKKIPASDGTYYDWEGKETPIYMRVYNKALALDRTSSQVEKLQVEQYHRDQTIQQMQSQIEALTSTLSQMMQANFKTPADQPTDPKHLEMIKKLKDS
jgi:integrase